MILGLFRKKPLHGEAAALAGVVTAQSRLPAFFLPPYGAPDTVEGRFEVTVAERRPGAAPPVHGAGARAGAGAGALGRPVHACSTTPCARSAFPTSACPRRCTSSPAPFRDAASPTRKRRKKKGTQNQARKNAPLADALARNVLAGQGDGAAFADYYRRAETLLAATALETFLRGEAPFPRRELGPL